MIIPVKEKIFELVKKRIVTKNKRDRINPSFLNAKKIGLIYTWEGNSKREVVDEFIKELEIAGKEVDTACFFKNLKSQDPPENDLIITRNDFNLFGRIISEELSNFISQNFDFLFHLDFQGNIFIENILARSQACCRIGRYDDRKKEYYDFMLDVGSNQKIEILCSEMMKYTKQIVTHD